MGSAKDRPRATTAVRNLFLAADYVTTNTDLATMEAANEAARMAANGVLDAAGSGAARCRIWKLEEPLLFEPLRKLDSFVYKLNKNSRPPLCVAAPEVLGLGKGKLSSPVQGKLLRWILDPPSRGFRALEPGLRRDGDLPDDAKARVEAGTRRSLTARAPKIC